MCAVFVEGWRAGKKLEGFPEIYWDNLLFIQLNGAPDKARIFRTWYANLHVNV